MRPHHYRLFPDKRKPCAIRECDLIHGRGEVEYPHRRKNKGKKESGKMKNNIAKDTLRELKTKGDTVLSSLRNKSTEMYKKGSVPLALFVFAAVSGAVPCTDGVYPFGVSLLCAAEGTVNAGAVFAGAMISTLGMREEAFFYITAYILILLARLCANAISGAAASGKNAVRTLFCESPYVRAAISAVAAALLGCAAVLRGKSLYFSLFSAVSGILIYSALTAGFIFVSERGAGASKKTFGVCAVCFSAVLVLKSISLPFSLAASAAFLITFVLSSALGCAQGFAAGLSCGIALGGDMAASLALIGGVAGLLFEYGDTLAVTVSSLCGFLLTGVTGGLSAVVEYIPEAAFSLAVIIPLMKLKVLPEDLISRAFEGGKKLRPEILTNAENYVVKERCESISRSLDSLSKLLVSVGDKMRCPTPQESYRICTAARARHCGGCRFSELCSGKEEKEVTSFFTNMAHSLSLRGKVSAAIVPESIARRCYNMDSILTSVNTSAQRLAGLSSAGERTELLASDYSAIANLLRETALSEADWEADAEGSARLRREMRSCGFQFESAAVYGSRRKKIYMYGVDCAASRAGERDIRLCAERTLSTKLSPVEFSVDGKTLSAQLHTVPKYTVKCGKFTGIGDRDTASGDSVITFENGDAMFYSLVSDGMGSGREAALVSGLSSCFLRELLSAGCPMKSALELLNCFVRGRENECFTTVDLMEADLITGRARFIKSGAAPSFVLRDGQLFRLHSKTVPVGIMRALDAEAISFDLCDDDTVIMMSDGVTGNYEDCPWLYSLMCDGLKREDSPSKMAKVIGEAALKNTGREDDVTVVVMKITAA